MDYDLDNFLYGAEAVEEQMAEQPLGSPPKEEEEEEEDDEDGVDIILEPREVEEKDTMLPTEDKGDGMHEGRPITEVPMTAFDDRPWSLPGADITDYFNYGFNEDTWVLYCEKQRTMREASSGFQRKYRNGTAVYQYQERPHIQRQEAPSSRPRDRRQETPPLPHSPPRYTQDWYSSRRESRRSSSRNYH